MGRRVLHGPREHLSVCRRKPSIEQVSVAASAEKLSLKACLNSSQAVTQRTAESGRTRCGSRYHEDARLQESIAPIAYECLKRL